MNYSNQDVAKILRSVATALTLQKANQFQVRAYETAADGIEHSTTEIQDLWEEKRLDEVPGIGEKLRAHLDELFRTGRVAHFESLKSHFPKAVYELIDIPGVGPKTALELAKAGVQSIPDLGNKLLDNSLSKIGLSVKLIEKLRGGFEEFTNLDDRMLLPNASEAAKKILEYLRASKKVKEAEVLGSLRRMVATVGDLDCAVATDEPDEVIEYFTKMPGVKEVVNKGESKATVVMSSGRHVDLLVGQPQSWGALLQHFTGSKQHNIKLREYALKKGLSLSEYGVKGVASGKNLESSAKIIPCKSEEDLYDLLKMQTPPPEIREDTGEIEAAINHKLPKLVQLGDIKGDLHLHSNFPLEPSHGPGLNSLEEIVKKGQELGYVYIGISDHSPSFTNHTPGQIEKLVAKRSEAINELKSTKSIRILNGLEIDILTDGTLSVPNFVLETLDYCIAGIHSSHKMDKEAMTKRLLEALKNPNVDIISHPSGRLLNQRSSFDVEWEVIFKYCAASDKVLEINAYPNRLDLRDDLVREALKYQVKFIINTDAHETAQMNNMSYGVAVARRGWVTAADVVNTWDWKKFAKWYKITI